MAITVVLAEDNVLLRDGIARVLTDADGIDLTATVGDLDGLLRLVDEDPPDVVVTDIRMPPDHADEGIRVAEHLRERHPHVGVVVLSQYVESLYAVRLLAAGSEGRAYLLKDSVADVDELPAAIQTVAAGGAVIDPLVVEALVAEKARSRGNPLRQLTPRELDVLREMATGKSNAAIADALVLSTGAIEKHSNAIFSKLGLSEERSLNRRVKAVLMFLDAQE